MSTYVPPYQRAPAVHTRGFPYSTRDCGEALPEFIRGRMGGKVEHPVAAAMLDCSMTLMGLARHYAQADAGEPDHVVLNRALGASDFGNHLVTSVYANATHTFAEAASGFRRICLPLRVRDFKPQRFGSLSLADFGLVPEFAEFQTVSTAAGSVIDEDSIATQGANFLISRQAIINDDAGSIAAMTRAIGTQAALAVASEVASKLSDTGNLDDGAALCNDTALNRYNTSGTAPSVADTDAALKLLWTQPTPAGSISGCAPRYLVAPPALHATAQTLVTAIFGDPPGAIGRPVDLIILPHLPSDAEWYWLADPQISPVLGLATLGESPLLVERVPLPPNRDGIALKARLDFRVLRLSRIGVVKVY